jgi:hypothetical protein
MAPIKLIGPGNGLYHKETPLPSGQWCSGAGGFSAKSGPLVPVYFVPVYVEIRSPKPALYIDMKFRVFVLYATLLHIEFAFFLKIGSACPSDLIHKPFACCLKKLRL